MTFTTSPTGGMTGGSSTIQLAASDGTSFPTGAFVYVSDLTTGTAQYGQTFSGADTSTLVIETYSLGTMAPGDVIQVDVFGVTNGSAGTTSLQVSTSSDPAPVSASYLLAPGPTSVSNVSVSLVGSTAGATEAAYTVDFTVSATGGLTGSNSSITLSAPAGTVFMDGAPVTVTDKTTNESWSAYATATNNTTLTIVNYWYGYYTYNQLHPGDVIEVVVGRVTNASAGTKSLTVSTTSDAAPATGSYTLAPGPTSVSNVAVSVAGSTADATQASYTVDFNVSATGGLSGAYSTITLAAPAGTVFPDSATVSVIDFTTSQSWQVYSTSTGSTVTIQGYYYWAYTYGQIHPGDHVQVIVDGVTNPSAGAKTLTVSTTSDTGPATGSYTLAPGPTSVSAVAASVSGAASGAIDATYTIDFTTSATGSLNSAHSTITVSAPAGTVFASSSVTLYDVAQGSAYGLGYTGGGTATLVARYDGSGVIPPNAHVRLVVTGVTNAPIETGVVSVSTSSDTAPVSATYTLAPPGAVAGVSVDVSGSTAGATQAAYRVRFRTASASSGSEWTVTLSAAVGTGFPGGSAYVTNLTSGASAWSSYASSATSTLTFSAPVTAAPGDQIEATIYGVTNGSAGTKTLLVSTSTDVTPVPVNYTLAVGPTSVSGLSVAVAGSTAGVTKATYTIDFTTSASGGLNPYYSDITVAGPAGTTISSAFGQAFLTDVTAGTTPQPVTYSSDGVSVITVQTYQLGVMIPAGHHLQLVLFGITNAAAGTRSLTVSTTSDTTPVSTTYSVAPGPTSVSNVSVAVSTSTAGATQTSYTVDFTSSPSGGLGASVSTIGLTGPVGTVFGSPTGPFGLGGFVTDVTAGVPYSVMLTTDGGTGVTATLAFYTGGTVPTAAPTLPAGHHIRLQVFGLTNAPAGPRSLLVSTSSDTTPVSANYTLTPGPTAITSGSVAVSNSHAGASSDYTVDFTTSAAGVLTAISTVTLELPADMAPSTALRLYDVDGGTALTSFVFALSANSVTVAYVDLPPIPGGRHLRLVETGVVNGAAGVKALKISTSSDATPVTVPFTLIP